MRMLVLVAAVTVASLGAAHAQEAAPVASVSITARPAPCPPWSGDAESARKHLEQTDTVTTSEGIGRGNARSLESRAFMKLYHSDEPGDAFVALYEKGKTAGKFWALLGLHFLGDQRESTLRADFMAGERGKIGRFLGGCCGDEVDAKKELPVWLAAIDDGHVQGLISEKPHVVAPVDHCPPWDGDAASARKCLAETDQVTTSALIGFGAERSRESRAFMKLYRSEKPGDAFVELYRSGKTAGKFWALLGLRFVGDPRAKDLRADFMASARPKIRTAQGGCCVSEVDPRRELPLWLAAIDSGDLKGLVSEEP